MKMVHNCICGLIAVFILSMPALAADPAYVTLVDQPRLLGAGEDFPGMWEYVYDVVDTGPVTFIMSAGLRGFDGTLVANRWKTTGNTINDVELWSGIGDPVEYQLHQKWDSTARYGYRRDPKVWYPSWWDGSQWEPPNSGAAGEAWAMANQWHDGSVYNDPFMNFPLPGTVSDNGVSFGAFDSTYSTVGPVLTFRILHPNGPGEIEYGIWHTGGADTVGSVTGPATPPPRGDFNGDWVVNALDIDDLCDNMGGDPATYDLTNDSLVNEDDLVEIVTAADILNTFMGDFNLDGVVNATDLGTMSTNFGLSGFGWAGGNANCDDVINATDLGTLSTNFGLGGGGSSVPEPATMSLLALGACLALFRRKRP